MSAQPPRADTRPEGRPARDLALYERLISEGIAAADRRGGAIDHVTARRLSIWLLSRQPQEPELMRGLIRFAKSGAVTQDLKLQLRKRARSPQHPHQPHAGRLLQYAVARGTDLGPIGPDFAGICDQIDQADDMLTDLRERVATHGRRSFPQPTWPDADGPQAIAMARHDPASRTVSFIFDTATANIAIHAITNHAVDREAHIREVEQYGRKLPENSHGRLNRQTIAARETRIAERLRAVERAYRAALDDDATPGLESVKTTEATEPTADRELELE